MCAEDTSTGTDPRRAQEGKTSSNIVGAGEAEGLEINPLPCLMFLLTVSDTGKDLSEDQNVKLTADQGGAADAKLLPLRWEQAPGQNPAAAALRSPDRPKADPAQMLEKPPVAPSGQKKSPSTAPAIIQTLERNTLSTISPAPESPEKPQVSRSPHRERSPSPGPAAELRNSVTGTRAEV